MPVRHRQSPGSRRRTVAALMLALAPACCAPVPSAPKPEPPPAVVNRPPEHVARPILHAAWFFRATPGACTALASAGSASLEVAVRPTGLIQLSLWLPGNPPERPVAHFNGPAGGWLIEGRPIGHREVRFLLGRTDTSLSRILMLLSGGMLYVGAPGNDLPALSLPESGTDGRQWFACAHRSVNQP